MGAREELVREAFLVGGCSCTCFYCMVKRCIAVFC